MRSPTSALMAAYKELLIKGTPENKARALSLLVIGGNLMQTITAPQSHLQLCEPLATHVAANGLHGIIVTRCNPVRFSSRAVAALRKEADSSAGEFARSHIVNLYEGDRLLFFSRPDTMTSFKLYDLPCENFELLLGIIVMPLIAATLN